MIGGSLALALKERELCESVIGIGRDESRLESARKSGLIDELETDLAAGIREASMVVICAPVDKIVGLARTSLEHARDHTIVTDVGSVKGDICQQLAASSSANGPWFVGSHPLAGSEKSGHEHAQQDLFNNKVTVVTRDGDCPEAIHQRVICFWEALGSRVVHMSAAEHDEILAMTSHLPHLVASCLASCLGPAHDDFTGTGFRDTTRIAAGDPALWLSIFNMNRAAVLKSLHTFRERLDHFEEALRGESDSAILSALQRGQDVRERIFNSDNEP